MSKRLKLIVALLVLFVAAFSTQTAFAASESEPNDSYSEATSIPVNTPVYGNLNDQYDDDWYQFQLTSSGYVRLDFNHTVNTTSTSLYYTVTLYNESRSTLASVDVKGSTSAVSLPVIGLPTGTYFVVVETYSSSTWSPAQYGFNVVFNASSYWEREFNDDYGNANPITTNNTYYGTMMGPYDDDWYQFDLTQPGYVRLRFSHAINTTSTSIYYTVTLYDENRSILTQMDVKGSTSSVTFPTIGLPAGTYFAMVETYSSYTWSPAKYSIKAEYSTSSFWEKEFNDEYGTANPISINNVYYGTLMNPYDDDWYQYKLTQPGSVKLYFSHSINTTSDSIYYSVTLYNESRDELTQMNIKGSVASTTLPTVGLPAGTYFVLVETYSSYTWSPAQYSIKAQFTASSSWEKEFNDEYSEANPISLNYTYNGTMMDYYDDDWYKINLPSAQAISIGFTQASPTTSSAYYYEVEIMDSSRYTLYYTYVPGSLKNATINTGTLSAGTYYIVVSTYSSSNWSAAQYSVKAVTKPPTVTSLKGASAGYNSVKLSWAMTSNVNGYEIYRSINGGSYSRIRTIESGSVVSYIDPSLSTGTTYSYKIRAYRTAGATKIYGNYSAIVSVKPIPSTPTNVSAVSASSSSIKIAWNAVLGATKYEIYRATSSTGTYSKLTETVSTSFINTGLTSGRIYYYRVRAYRLVGNTRIYGGYSTIVSAKP